MHRVGIIPFDITDEAVTLLFVTSQTRGRWILPKGRQKRGETHVETCHREGFEEAGVRGIVIEDFPITVRIGKSTAEGVRDVPVTYYPYLVWQQEDKWPEQVSRERHWVLLEDADKVAFGEDYLTLLRQFELLCEWITIEAREHILQQAPQQRGSA